MATRKHKHCRPPNDMLIDAERMSGNGRRAEDNGKPGLAFIGMTSTNVPYAVYARCDCFANRCPGRLAMVRAAKIWGAANGLQVEGVM